MMSILLALLAIGFFTPINAQVGAAVAFTDPESESCRRYFACLKNTSISSHYDTDTKPYFVNATVVYEDMMLVEKCNHKQFCSPGVEHELILERLYKTKTARYALMNDEELRNCYSTVFRTGNCFPLYYKAQSQSQEDKSQIFFDCMVKKSIESEHCSSKDTNKIQMYGSRIVNGFSAYRDAVEIIGQSNL